MSETVTKPGYKTFGFYVALALTAVSGLMGSGVDLGAAGSVMATAVTGLTAVGYAAFRAFKKSDDPSKPSWKTTEFWLTVLAALLSALNFSGLISDHGTAAQVVAAVSGFLAMLGYQVTKPKK